MLLKQQFVILNCWYLGDLLVKLAGPVIRHIYLLESRLLKGQSQYGRWVFYVAEPANEFEGGLIGFLP